MFDFSQLAKTGEMVVEFINAANARLSSLEATVREALAEIRAHREKIEPQVERLELAHKEIFDWIADIEGGEIVEAAAAIETAVVQAETAAELAVAAETAAVAAAETAVAEIAPAEPETPPAEPAPLEETPIPLPPPEPTKPKRNFVRL